MKPSRERAADGLPGRQHESAAPAIASAAVDIFLVLSSVGVRYWSYCCVRWKLVTLFISFSSNRVGLRRNEVSLALNSRGSSGLPPVSIWSPSGLTALAPALNPKVSFSEHLREDSFLA